MCVIWKQYIFSLSYNIWKQDLIKYKILQKLKRILLVIDDDHDVSIDLYIYVYRYVYTY